MWTHGVHSSSSPGCPQLFLEEGVRETVCHGSHLVSAHWQGFHRGGGGGGGGGGSLSVSACWVMSRSWHYMYSHALVHRYGQMTAGSFCYIGPQGIVHGTTVHTFVSIYHCPDRLACDHLYLILVEAWNHCTYICVRMLYVL